ncbi:MAG TPA: HAD-IA family hydrolase [Chitinophagaceae bacterium]|jgi:HAD superfamily hydrolase (TIGR01509 family)|nr:HAD-IA family hydrolase [Chitinophagaceae bacterium]
MTDLSTTEAARLEQLLSLTRGDYQAFLYDCDGTLAENVHLHKAAFVKAAAAYGITLDDAIVDELAGWPTVKVAEEISRRYGVTFDPVTFAHEKSAIFVDEFLVHTEPKPFVVEHLKRHHGKLKIGVVSGGRRSTVTRTLEVLGLEPLLDVIVCAGETERGKPYPDPFLAAARALGVPPEACMVFEDANAGVQAAESAGMKWVRVDRL